MSGEFAKSEIRCENIDIFFDLLDSLFGGEGGFTVEERMNEKVGFESHDTKWPDIDSLCEFLSLIEEELGSPVDDSAGYLVGGLLHGWSSKVGDFEDPFGIDDILRFNVSMNNFLLMNNHQAVGHIDQHLDVLVLNQVVHLYLVPQRELSQLKENVNVIANDPEYKISYVSPK